MCKGLAWLILTGSGFDDCIYWCCFTIIINYDSSKSMTLYDSLHYLLDHEFLLFHCDVWRTKNHCSHIVLPWTTSVWLICHESPTDLSNESESESESHFTTDGQSACLSWNKAPIWGSRPDFDYCQTVAGLLMWGALSDEKMDLTFTSVGGSRQRSQSRVRVSWDLSTIFYCLRFETSIFVASYDSQGTVEVFDISSTR
jgi:hypothetical protein